MKRNWAFLSMTIWLSLVLGSCATLGNLSNSLFQKPVVSLRSVSITDIDLQQIGLRADLDVYNPNPYSVPVRELQYSFYMDKSSSNKPFVSGSVRSETALSALVTNLVSVPVSIPLDGLLSLPSISNRIYYTVKGQALIKGFDAFPVPFEYSASFAVPRMPLFSIQSIRLVGFSPLQLKSSVALSINIENPNEFSLNMQDIRLKLELAGKPVLTKEHAPPVLVLPQSKETINLAFDLDFTPLKDVLTAILKLAKVNVRFSGGFSVDSLAGVKKSFEFDTNSEVLIQK